MNVIDLPKTDSSDLAAGIERLKRNLPLTLEFLLIEAQITRAKYKALIDQGFTPAEALQLCQKG